MTSPWPRRLTFLILAATVGQLAVATFVPGLSQFESKGFGARLVAYPVMMLGVPAIWAVRARRRATTAAPVDGTPRGAAAAFPRPDPVANPASPPPWTAFALVMAPFLIDVTGNTLNLYDSVAWWDDANHFVNWFLLNLGLGLLMLRSSIRPPWALGLLVAGVGALLAIGWEVGEWYAFIRHGTELATAYEDTLGDEVLGSLGAGIAGAVIARRAARAREERQAAPVG